MINCTNSINRTDKQPDTVESALMTRGGKREGAGRKSKYEEESISRGFRIPASLDREITQRAETQNISASELVVKALKKAFRIK